MLSDNIHLVLSVSTIFLVVTKHCTCIQIRTEMQPIMCRQTSSVPYSDTNGVNPTHTRPLMKEDPPKLPLCWSLELPVTSRLQQLDWFTHVQPSPLPPQRRKPISVAPHSAMLNIYTIPHPTYLTHLPTWHQSCRESTLRYQWQIREVRQSQRLLKRSWAVSVLR